MADARARPGAIRWVLAGAALIVGAAAVTKSAALALANRRPDTARTLDPWSGAALSAMAVRDVQQARDPAAVRSATAMATRAVALDPTNASALGALSFGAPDKAAAARALRASEGLSRRSLITQLALIEDAVARDDVRGALRHYDIALRTSRGAASILFPVLVPAGLDAGLMPDIARLLAIAPWSELYQMQLAQSATDYPAVARLFERLYALGARPSPTALASFFQRAVDAQAYPSAWRVYAADPSATDRGTLRNGDFRRVVATPGPFDWQVSDGGAVTTEIAPGAGGGPGRLSFTTNMGEGGLVARQLVILPPGTHYLRGRAAEISAPADARPYWRLDCAITGGELGRQSLATNGAFSFAMTVPPGCTAQWLSLMVLPPSGIETISGSVAGLSLR